jgi:hypothetical protein
MRLRPRPAVLLTALAALLIGCGDDDAPTVSRAPDVDRYCAVSERIDAVGGGEYEDLAQDPVAANDLNFDVEVGMVREHEDLLVEIQKVVPDEIRTDVWAVLRVIEARAGLQTDWAEAPELRASERAVARFEKENCPDE